MSDNDWRALLVVGGALLAGLAGGCAAPQPHAAASNVTASGEEPQWRPVLDSQEQQSVREHLRTAAGDHDPVDPPRPAATGMRWSDVPRAASDACDDAEMAVVHSESGPDLYQFTIRTIEDWPGWLIVRRTGDQRVYEASAGIGRFDDHEARKAALLDALDRYMRAYGRKRGFREESDEATKRRSD